MNGSGPLCARGASTRVCNFVPSRVGIMTSCMTYRSETVACCALLSLMNAARIKVANTALLMSTPLRLSPRLVTAPGIGQQGRRVNNSAVGDHRLNAFQVAYVIERIAVQ